MARTRHPSGGSPLAIPLSSVIRVSLPRTYCQNTLNTTISHPLCDNSTSMIFTKSSRRTRLWKNSGQRYVIAHALIWAFLLKRDFVGMGILSSQFQGKPPFFFGSNQGTPIPAHWPKNSMKTTYSFPSIQCSAKCLPPRKY